MDSNANETSEMFNTNLSMSESNNSDHNSSSMRVDGITSNQSTTNLARGNTYHVISDVVVFEEDIDERLKLEPPQTIIQK